MTAPAITAINRNPTSHPPAIPTPQLTIPPISPMSMKLMRAIAPTAASVINTINSVPLVSWRFFWITKVYRRTEGLRSTQRRTTSSLVPLGCKGLR
jgi:hypothetical protein